MLQLWKARRGRKAAMALIYPFVERSRIEFGGIPDSVWHDTYLIGFLAMLASLAAREQAGSLQSNALGLVQSETLAALSGHDADVFGQAICALSMEREPSFGAGCRDATGFYSALHQSDDASFLPNGLSGGDSLTANAGIHELWRQTFEARLTLLI